MLIRSIIFYVLLGLWTIFMGTICLPYLFFKFQHMRKPVNIWILGIFSLLKRICKITYEIRGGEHIPNYPCLIASKHQSAFETFALYYHISNSIFIHKKQLFKIPIFGQYLKKSNMISIDRSGGTSAMRKILRETKKRISNGSSIIIFPEGTRKKPNDIANYKSGIAGIYEETRANILPVAVNSGKYWPKDNFVKKPGHIIISFLKIIPYGLERSDLLKKIEKNIETETQKII